MSVHRLPSRRRKASALDVILLIAFIAAAWLTESYLVMLLIGGIHLEVWDKLPPFGLAQVLLIQFGLFLVSAWVRSFRH